jgi:hydroxyethylthiazole kinase
MALHRRSYLYKNRNPKTLEPSTYMTSPQILTDLTLELERTVREKAPLVHNITNYVVMNFTANITLALGAQPVMAHAPEELEEMVGYASALVLNIGTLDRYWVESMILAGNAASKRGIPVILDPVGAGATKLRTETAMKLLDEVAVSVIRGNAGEILALAGQAGAVRGVDSTAKADSAREIAQNLASQRELTVAVTGPVDLITDGSHTFEVRNGHPLMGRVTGTGCGATATIAAFVGIAKNEEHCAATACALARYGLAGEVAASRAQGPGSFVPAFLDALASVDATVLSNGLKLSQS